MATLLALFGPKRGVRIDLAETCVVGRLSAADVQLIDEKVSREHCKFTVADGAVKVEDMGSHNGTFVNGEQLTAPRTLAPGDEIAVGDSLFVFQPELDVAPARFGDATLIVSPATPPGTAVEPGVSGAPRAAAVTPAHLTAVAKLAGALAGAADTESAARAVLEAIGQSLKGDRAFVLLWDPVRRSVTPLVGKSDGPAVTISRRVLETAADGKKVVSIDDAVESRSFKDSKSVIRHGLRSVLVAPVMHGTQVEGFLHIDSKQVSAYTEADVHLLTAFAALAASHRLGLGRTHAPNAARVASAGVSGFSDRPAGDSASWKEALRISESAAAVSSTILVTGESGTGKEEIARFVHTRSPRSAKPFVAVNCGAIPEALAESELFGHEKGAFTGATGMREGKVEAADGGTLFLDEIGDLPLSIQVKLLRVLQERAFYRVGSTIPRRVDIRVIAATHHDLEAEVKSGRFREDLFYRLNVLRIHLPPLRERTEDLEPLARALLTRVCVSVGRKNPGLSKEALGALMAHPWPGNARELANVLERMVVLRPGGTDAPFGRADVGSALGAGPGAAADSGADVPGATLADKVAALEKSEVEAALKRARGVKSRAAEMLGISRPTLDKKIADLAIDIWKDV